MYTGERKVFIPVLGKSNVGKSTFVSEFTKEVGKVRPDLTVGSIRISDFLTNFIDKFNTSGLGNLERTPDTYSKLAKVLTGSLGFSVLASATHDRLITDRNDIVLIDGVRQPETLEAIVDAGRNFEGNQCALVKVVEVVCDNDLKRYLRGKKRREKVGEELLSLEEFLERERDEDYSYSTAELGKYVTNRINNDGSLSEFRVSVRKFAGSVVAELTKPQNIRGFLKEGLNFV